MSHRIELPPKFIIPIFSNYRETERPIAIAYTPTEPNTLYKPQPNHNNNNNNVDVDEFGNPSRGEHYQHNFDAPFFPSVNLEGAPSTHTGWAVVTAATPNTSKLEKRNDMISPSLPNAAHAHLEPEADTSSSQVEEGQSIEVITQKFNIDSFQPELQSGFKPIFTVDAPEKPARVQEKPSATATKDDSIEALIYEDSGDDSNNESETENSEMTTLS